MRNDGMALTLTKQRQFALHRPEGRLRAAPAKRVRRAYIHRRPRGSNRHAGGQAGNPSRRIGEVRKTWAR